MVLQLEITEEMIKCFHLCTKRGDYHQLFNDYRQFFSKLSENLKKVDYGDNNLYNFVSKDSRFIFDYLWNPCEQNKKIFGTSYMGRMIPHFVELIEKSIVKKNWDAFYEYYIIHSKEMFNIARAQGIIDLRIELDSGSYNNFHERDEICAAIEKMEAGKSSRQIQGNGIRSFRELFQPRKARRHTTQAVLSANQKESSPTSVTDSVPNKTSSQNVQKEVQNSHISSSKPENDDARTNSQRIDLKNIERRHRLLEMEDEVRMVEERIKEREAQFETANSDKKETSDQYLIESQKEFEKKLQILEIKIDEKIGRSIEKIEENMKSLNSQFEVQTSNLKNDLKMDKTIMEDTTSKMFCDIKLTLEDQIEAKVMNLDVKIESLESNFNDKLEEKLNKKLVQLELRLDSKINGKIEELEEKMKLRDACLESKMNEMMELIKQIQQNSVRETIPEPTPRQLIEPEKSFVRNETSETVIDIPEAPDQSDIIHNRAATQPNSILDDEEVRKIQEDFKKTIDAQNQAYEVKLRRIQERRREMNKTAEEERRRLSGSLTRSAAGRWSFHS